MATLYPKQRGRTLGVSEVYLVARVPAAMQHRDPVNRGQEKICVYWCIEEIAASHFSLFFNDRNAIAASSSDLRE